MYRESRYPTRSKRKFDFQGCTTVRRRLGECDTTQENLPPFVLRSGNVVVHGAREADARFYPIVAMPECQADKAKFAKALSAELSCSYHGVWRAGNRGDVHFFKVISIPEVSVGLDVCNCWQHVN